MASAIKSKADRLKANMRESIGVGVGMGKSPAPAPALSATIEIDGPLAGIRSGGGLTMIDVDRIAPDPGQPRKTFDPAEILDMAKSLKSVGQLQPLRVYWGPKAKKYLIVFGERRWRGAKEAGLKALECVVLPGKPEPARLRLEQLVENLQRVNVPPMEEAVAFAEILVTEGWTAARLAEALGVSEAKIGKSIALTRLAPRVQSFITVGQLSPAAAYHLSRLKNENDQFELAELAIDNELSRDQLANVVAHRLKRSEKPGQSEIPFEPPAPAPTPVAEPKPEPDIFPRERSGPLASPADETPIPPIRIHPTPRIAGWESPYFWGEGSEFDFRTGSEETALGWNRHGVSVSLGPEARWPEVVMALESALHAARFRERLARVPGGGARPGDRVRLDDPESPWHECDGAILDYDPARGSLWVEFTTTTGLAEFNPPPERLRPRT